MLFWQFPIHTFLRLLCRLLRQSQSLITEDPTREKSNKLLFAIGLNRQNLEVGKLVSKAKSLIPPRAAMLWIGADEDATSIDDLITSESITGRPILDLEKLDFKIARGLRKI